MKAFLLVFAVAATALVAWLLFSEGSQQSRGGRGREAVFPEEPARPAPEVEGVRGPARTEAPPGRVFSLSGYVRDTTGTGIAGAVVRVMVQGGSVADTAGAEGEYAVEVPYPLCAFDVWAQGYLPVVGTFNGRSNGEQVFVFDGEGPWRKDFTLRPAASLVGSVFDEAGQPVKGARVYVIPAQHSLLDRETVANVVTSDDRGEFAFPGLPAGVTDIGVRADGYLPLIAKDVTLPDRGTVRQDLRLVRGREILVTVVNAPKGELSVEIARTLFVYSVQVTAADSRLRGMLLPPGGIDALVDGLVGRAFADFAVAGGRQLEDGRYRVSGAGAGPVDVAARVTRFSVASLRPEFALIAEPGLSEKLDTVAPEVTLTLVPATVATITVRDAVTGNLLEPAVVRKTAGVPEDLPVDRDGTTYLLPRDQRRHALAFALDGYQEAKLDLPDLRQFPVDSREPPSFDIAMQPSATGEAGAFYVVFDPPLDGRIALVGRDSTGTPRWQKHVEAADKEGKWAVEEVPVGEYAVSVLATGMVPAFLPRVVIARGLKDTYRVTLTPGGGLSLKVTDAEGQILDQVQMLLKDQAGNQIDVHVLSHVSEGRAFVSINYLPSAAVAKADSGLAPGFYEIRVYREGYALGTKSFEVRGTDVAVVEIALAKAPPPK